MDRWDLLIIFAAGYVAVMTLVRLMAGRRNQLVDQVRGQLDEQRTQQRKAAQLTKENEVRDVA
jgi:hypothetical protein